MKHWTNKDQNSPIWKYKFYKTRRICDNINFVLKFWTFQFAVVHLEFKI